MRPCGLAPQGAGLRLFALLVTCLMVLVGNDSTHALHAFEQGRCASMCFSKTTRRGAVNQSQYSSLVPRNPRDSRVTLKSKTEEVRKAHQVRLVTPKQGQATYRVTMTSADCAPSEICSWHSQLYDLQPQVGSSTDLVFDDEIERLEPTRLKLARRRVTVGKSLQERSRFHVPHNDPICAMHVSAAALRLSLIANAKGRTCTMSMLLSVQGAQAPPYLRAGPFRNITHFSCFYSTVTSSFLPRDVTVAFCASRSLPAVGHRNCR